ncbi:MAG: hypothetical protein COV48_03715, partial [Elusimicrobia bacterium CG11_big_fil_rev_8_21_14_0_20_64_6]
MPGGDLARAAAGLTAAAILLGAAAWTDGTRRPSLSPERAAVLWDAALVARNEGRSQEILAPVRRLLASYPRDGRYLELEAMSLGSLGDRRGEAQAWEQYLAWSPAPAEACPRLGRAYERLGNDPAALDAHRRCLALDPQKADLRLNYARALVSAGRNDEAEPIYESVLRDYPDYLDAALFLGRLKLNRGDHAAAAALIEPVIKARPNESDPLLFGALVDLAGGDLARAEARLRLALKDSPRYADLYRVLARVCNARNNAPCARQALAAA